MSTQDPVAEALEKLETPLEKLETHLEELETLATKNVEDMLNNMNIYRMKASLMKESLERRAKVQMMEAGKMILEGVDVVVEDHVAEAQAAMDPGLEAPVTLAARVAVMVAAADGMATAAVGMEMMAEVREGVEEAARKARKAREAAMTVVEEAARAVVEEAAEKAAKEAAEAAEASRASSSSSTHAAADALEQQTAFVGALQAAVAIMATEVKRSIPDPVNALEKLAMLTTVSVKMVLDTFKDIVPNKMPQDIGNIVAKAARKATIDWQQRLFKTPNVANKVAERSGEMVMAVAALKESFALAAVEGAAASTNFPVTSTSIVNGLKHLKIWELTASVSASNR